MIIRDIRQRLTEYHSVLALKAMIVIWAILLVFFVVFFIDNKWVLAGILLYEVLP
jgi:hypothetical protein